MFAKDGVERDCNCGLKPRDRSDGRAGDVECGACGKAIGLAPHSQEAIAKAIARGVDTHLKMPWGPPVPPADAGAYKELWASIRAAHAAGIDNDPMLERLSPEVQKLLREAGAPLIRRKMVAAMLREGMDGAGIETVIADVAAGVVEWATDKQPPAAAAILSAVLVREVGSALAMQAVGPVIRQSLGEILKSAKG